MQALVLTENGRLALEDRPRPEPPAPGWVQVRVAAAGVCGSDIPRAFAGGAYHYPLVLGHEFSAVVEEVPAGSSYAPGDRVAVFPLIPNAEEEINLVGEYAVARRYDYFGSRRDGAFQELLNVPEFNLLPVPDGLDMVAASMVEPCAVAYHAASKPEVHAGDRALVLGGGPIGAMVAQWLHIRGCRPVVVSEPDEKKRAVLTELGVASINPAESEPDLADIVVEAVGLPATFRQAIDRADLFGRVVFLGNIHGELTLTEKEVSSILRRELTIHGTWNSKLVPHHGGEWSRVLDALASKEVRVDALISHRVDLAAGAGILGDMAHKRTWYNKVVLMPSGELR